MGTAFLNVIPGWYMNKMDINNMDPYSDHNWTCIALFNINLFMYLTRNPGRITYLNKNAVRLNGVTLDSGIRQNDN